MSFDPGLKTCNTCRANLNQKRRRQAEHEADSCPVGCRWCSTCRKHLPEESFSPEHKTCAGCLQSKKAAREREIEQSWDSPSVNTTAEGELMTTDMGDLTQAIERGSEPPAPQQPLMDAIVVDEETPRGDGTTEDNRVDSEQELASQLSSLHLTSDQVSNSTAAAPPSSEVR